MHKRYLVFAYDNYYPSGGLDDIKDTFDNEQDAKAFAEGQDGLVYRYDNVEIYDRIEGKYIPL